MQMKLLRSVMLALSVVLIAAGGYEGAFGASDAPAPPGKWVTKVEAVSVKTLPGGEVTVDALLTYNDGTKAACPFSFHVGHDATGNGMYLQPVAGEGYLGRGRCHSGG